MFIPREEAQHTWHSLCVCLFTYVISVIKVPYLHVCVSVVRRMYMLVLSAVCPSVSSALFLPVSSSHQILLHSMAVFSWYRVGSPLRLFSQVSHYPCLFNHVIFGAGQVMHDQSRHSFFSHNMFDICQF